VSSLAGKKEAADLLRLLLSKVSVLPAAATADTDAHSRNMEADAWTMVVATIVVAAPAAIVASIVPVAFAVDHSALATLAPAAAELIAHHANVLHAVIDGGCHGAKWRSDCATCEKRRSAGDERNDQLAHCVSSQVVGIVTR
jgi:hypothetical protein